MAEMTMERDSWMRRIGPLYPGLVALCLLTAVPLPRGLEPTDDDVSRAAWWFPVIGMAIGMTLAAMAWFLLAIGLVPGLAAIVVAIASVAVTRGSLERGVAETVRATSRGRGASSGWLPRFFVHARPDEGWDDAGPVVWSTVAVVCVLVLRTGALVGMNSDSYLWWAGLIVAYASARWVLILAARLVERPASEATLLRAIGDISWKMFGFSSAGLVVLALALGGLAVGAIVLAMALVAYGITRWLQQRADGMSDSLTSALACACEVAVLLALAAVHPAVQSPWTL